MVIEIVFGCKLTNWKTILRENMLNERIKIAKYIVNREVFQS